MRLSGTYIWGGHHSSLGYAALSAQQNAECSAQWLCVPILSQYRPIEQRRRCVRAAAAHDALSLYARAAHNFIYSG